MIRCLCLGSALVFDVSAQETLGSTSIFRPVSTPAQSIFGLALFVTVIAALIFVVVAGLLTYSIFRFRHRGADNSLEPPQVYGSNEIELAWTVIPIITVLTLFLAATRVMWSIEGTSKPRGALDVTVIGHQYWWEFRYPALNIVTANELHIPVSDAAYSRPTFLTLRSVDTDHSFWVPRLAGKMDLIPNHTNTMWLDPKQTGIFEGQCAQYCGTAHAKMLLRVYVQSADAFDHWVQEQKIIPLKDQPAAVLRGKVVFETNGCLDCHKVSGVAGNGRYGPDLTHLVTRDTIASGVATNTPTILHKWIKNPNSLKPGSTMPALLLSSQQIDDVVAYLEAAGPRGPNAGRF